MIEDGGLVAPKHHEPSAHQDHRSQCAHDQYDRQDPSSGSWCLWTDHNHLPTARQTAVNES